MSPTSTPRQETVSVDQIIDRLLRKGCSTTEIVNLVNGVFLVGKITTEYIELRRHKLLKYRQQLAHLKEIPKIEQRTVEWYDARKSIVTASDFAQALGDAKFGTQRQFFIKKSGWVEEAFNANSPPLKWGVMFEPIASLIYAQRNSVGLHEFGLLKHPTLSYFGASPDGINDDGIMVEIKCPYRRKVTGQVPLQYFYQIQGQLDVCGLDECDYLECEFAEYDEQAFLADSRYIETGIIVEYKHPDDSYTFHYGDIVRDLNSRQSAYKDIIAMPSPEGCEKVLHFWWLDVLNCIRVIRDNDFLSKKLPELKKVWNQVLAFRADKALYDKEFSRSARRTLKMDTSVDIVDGVLDEQPRPATAKSGYMFQEEDDG